jgi:hypothetical protein
MDIYKTLYQNDFESSLEPIVHDGLIKIGTVSYEPATVLKIQQSNYDLAFDEWKAYNCGELKKNFAESINWLKSNENRFDDLLEIARKDLIIPFIGSGMSKPSGIPIWRDFLLSLAENCLSESQLKVIHLVNDYKFEEAASLIFNSIPIELFDEAFDHSCRTKNVQGAIKLLPILNPNIMITTNYDRVVELLYEPLQIGCNPLYGENISNIEPKRIDSTQLVKLHGDLKNPDYRILTKEEYSKFYNKKNKHIKQLIYLLKNFSLIFLGCSLQQDRMLKLISELHNENKRIKHFALLEDKGASIRKIREHFLASHGIFTIWYKGEHDMSINSAISKLLMDLGKL